MITFKANKARFRATFNAGDLSGDRVGQVDEENEILRGVQITVEGEAKGHDVHLDREFCEAVAEQGNSLKAGVKVRFGHPGMCSDALGTYLGRATNFRVVDITRTTGEQAAAVIADVALAEEAHQSPHGDLAAWIMAAAKNSPDTFGQSIVFTYADWKVKDADGSEHLYSQEVATDEKPISFDEWMAKSADGKVYAVLGKLLGTDFTDTPAATDGVFSSDSLAAEAEEMLDEHPQIVEVLRSHPENVVEFLKRTDLLDAVESVRVSHLQAAKDKEISALKAELAARDERIKVEEENFAKAKEALDLATAEIEQLKVSKAKANEALAHVCEQFQSLKDKHAELTGAALNPVTVKAQFASFADAVNELGYIKAVKEYPELAAAYRRGEK